MEVVLAAPGGPWSQIASMAFLSAGIFADLLIVRLLLTLAYLFLLLHALTGFQPWPGVGPSTDSPFVVAVDTIVWSVLGMYVHGASFFGLLIDERTVRLSTQEEELWRMFYRRSGISRLLFQRQILSRGEFRTYARGDVIGDPTMPKRLHVIIQGRVHGRVTVADGGEQELHMLSGDLFEFQYLHLFGVAVGFVDRQMTTTARSAVRTFSIGVEDLQEMAVGPAATRQAWQAVIIAVLAREAERQYRGKRSSVVQTSAERDTWCDPSFRELGSDELPPEWVPGSGSCLRRPLRNLLKVMAKTFSPPFPFRRHSFGLRHTAINTTPDTAAILETAYVLREAQADWSVSGGKKV